ncbi:hypothetical protein LCGC14_0985290 [marine sediment metagenome]|uniref:Uncharacterized protein n=1 Tax=marine sediment metagenome TaxID=412755 RepID=A0A0F9NTV0_9ZZZZ
MSNRKIFSRFALIRENQDLEDFFLIDLSLLNYYLIIQETNSLYPLIKQITKSYNIEKTFIKGEYVFERN